MGGTFAHYVERQGGIERMAPRFEGLIDGCVRRCCADALELGTRPTRDGLQAVRSKLGRPSPVIRLRTRTPILASVF